VDNRGQIIWNNSMPVREGFDFGFYDDCTGGFWHATGGIVIGDPEENRILLSQPEIFAGGDRSTIYCVACEGDGSNDSFNRLPASSGITK
jgi:hypothetical protein